MSSQPHPTQTGRENLECSIGNKSWAEEPKGELNCGERIVPKQLRADYSFLPMCISHRRCEEHTAIGYRISAAHDSTCLYAMMYSGRVASALFSTDAPVSRLLPFASRRAMGYPTLGSSLIWCHSAKNTTPTIANFQSLSTHGADTNSADR